MAPLPTLAQLLQQHPLPARKALGQHFLLDERITDRIVTFAGNVTDTSIIEIGPGPGGLTRSLLAAGAKQVVAIEKDERALPLLRSLQAAADGRLTILEADALTIDATSLTPAPRMIVANLPYNVGTALLIQWLHLIHDNPNAFTNLTLMFQKEVAERIAAAPDCKDYGRLSVLAQWLCEIDYGFELPPGAFSPPPKVSSAVIKLIPRQERIAVDKKSLEKVLAAGFNQRRKMLRGALKTINGEALLEKAGIDGTRRAETLTLSEWCHLANQLQ